MPVTDTDKRLLGALENGLPLASRPFAEAARRLGVTESDVVARLQDLVDDRVVRRFGLVLRHRELGFTANAMIVWDVSDAMVGEAGARLAAFPFVTLCYRRPRRPPVWPYTLFCMIHGRDRATVLGQVETARRDPCLAEVPYAVLFSRRCFKQRGARYGAGRVLETA
jgi:DNA-binding Lrp family transcriptional regulator